MGVIDVEGALALNCRQFDPQRKVIGKVVIEPESWTACIQPAALHAEHVQRLQIQWATLCASKTTDKTAAMSIAACAMILAQRSCRHR
jgi:hypothetical protein